MNKSLKIIHIIINAIVISTMALLFTSCKPQNVANKMLILYNNESNKEIASFPIKQGFSIEFMHSVNKTPVKDFYKFNENNDIFVYKTEYYGFGAGVQTELNEGENISYGENGKMTINHIDKKIDELTYYLSSVYDHILQIDKGKPISLWDICGKNIIIRIEIK